MSRIEVLLRRTEKSLNAIDIPTTARNDSLGQGRTILPNSKVRELENLTERLSEIQSLISENGSSESNQEWLNGLRQRLKERVVLVFEPPKMVLAGGGND